MTGPTVNQSAAIQDEFQRQYENEPVETWNPAAVGAQLIGTFLRHETFQVLDPETGVEDTISYVIIKSDGGDNYKLNESYQIGRAFIGVADGTRIRLTFTGEQKMAKAGRNPMKCYSLDVARARA